MAIDRLKAQLLRQLGYVHRSCTLFDLGHRDEAIRIATALRVMLHDGPKPRKGEGSILRQLGATTVQLTTTVRPEDRSRSIMFDGFLHLPWNMRPWKEYLSDPPMELVFPKWWDQPLFVINKQPISRRDLVLGAANKDGGAHVDTKLSPGYKAAMTMWITSTQVAGQPPVQTPLSENHLFALRRIGLEVLHSSALYPLAGLQGPQLEDTTKLYRASPDHFPVMDRAIDISRHRSMGDSLASAGQHAEAIASYSRALELLDEIRIALLLGSAAENIRIENHREAASLYDSALSAAPKNARALYGAGFAKNTLGLLEEARRHLEEAILEDPAFLPAYHALATVYLKLSRPSDAMPLLDRILSDQPDDDLAQRKRTAALSLIRGPV